METTKVLNILDVVIERLRKAQILERSQFDVCLSGQLSDVIHSDLEGLVVDLFDEHTRITSLINDVCDLRSALSKFDMLAN